MPNLTKTPTPGNLVRYPALLGLLVACLSNVAGADSPDPAQLTPIEVTATRVPLPVRLVPVSVTIVTGEQLEALGARDLRTAMSLVAGVDIAPGGDGGPAASVPGMWGLREFDAFLLVVDGVPWGGAFNPELAAIILSDVDRIEVLRGSAPVVYGATSFVGVIHVIHRAAGDSERLVRGSYGSYDSASFTGSVDLPPSERYRHTLAFEVETRGFSDPQAGFDRGHVLYRGALDAGVGQLQFDLNAILLRQDPASPHVREGQELSPDFPLDANYNPSDAHLDQDFYQMSGTYDRPIGDLDWSSTLSLNQISNNNVRGFLHEGYVDDGSTPNAAGFTQDRDTSGVYFDTHVLQQLGSSFQAMLGLDYLYGKAEQTSDNFDYYVSADGTGAPSSGSQPVAESVELRDQRNFYGAYLQMTGQLTQTLGLLAGVRLNHTQESRHTAEEALDEVEGEQGSDHLTETRPGGMIGLSWGLWQKGVDFLAVYANYRNAYKPAAIDFGPESDSEILDPETGASYEGGIKSNELDGALDLEISYFDMRMKNLVVTQSIEGRPGLTNAGEEHFRGIEIEAHYRFSDDLLMAGNYAWHDARFGDYEQLFGDTLTQLDGKRLEMSPNHLAALGLVYHPQQGLHGSVVWNYVGSLYLNKRNTALSEAYSIWDVTLGWRFEDWNFTLAAYNLGDERRPSAESELGESQYYRYSARSIEAFVTYSF